eukprot:jgi/Psemu1/195867/e_gw1.179.67.1
MADLSEGEPGPGSPTVTPISYVEFYSGVGGWTMALEEALDRLDGAAHCYELKRLAALDHSDLCVKVFSHNFSAGGTNHGTNGNENKTKNKNQPQRVQPKSFSIERMPIRQLEEWSADVWVMSPPCQPHTRQHNTDGDNSSSSNNNSEPSKKDLDDPRSKSFLKICKWLEGTPNDENNNNNNKGRRIRDESLPSLIFLENVVGFESSSSFKRWTSALRSREYQTGHFHLTPTQVRLPNDRPRYYCVAVRCTKTNKKTKTNAEPDADADAETETGDKHGGTPIPGENNTVPRIWKAIPELRVTPEDDGCTEEIPPISSFLDDDKDGDGDDQSRELLRVPEKVLSNKSAWCFDIVCPSDRRSSCFTHSYGRFVRGTGSILYECEDPNESLGLLPPDEREFSDDWKKGLDPSRLRYFSGNELARLFGFSSGFSFPSDTSPRQHWKLMGNSLNVGVASKLVELGFLLRYHYRVDRWPTTTTTTTTTTDDDDDGRNKERGTETR